MLFQPYHESLTAGQIREYLKDYPDHAPVVLDGGDDWSHGHELYATKPKEFYMPSQDSLSRRLGPVFAEVAAKAQPRMTMEQHKAECHARPIEDSLHGAAALALRGGKPGLAAALAYKPAHGGCPG